MPSECSKKGNATVSMYVFTVQKFVLHIINLFGFFVCKSESIFNIIEKSKIELLKPCLIYTQKSKKKNQKIRNIFFLNLILQRNLFFFQSYVLWWETLKPLHHYFSSSKKPTSKSSFTFNFMANNEKIRHATAFARNIAVLSSYSKYFICFAYFKFLWSYNERESNKSRRYLHQTQNKSFTQKLTIFGMRILAFAFSAWNAIKKKIGSFRQVKYTVCTDSVEWIDIMLLVLLLKKQTPHDVIKAVRGVKTYARRCCIHSLLDSPRFPVSSDFHQLTVLLRKH